MSLIGLCALGLLARAEPAAAGEPSAAAPAAVAAPDPTDFHAQALAALSGAQAKADSGDEAAVVLQLTPLVDSPQFSSLAAKDRSQVFSLLAWAAYRQGRYQAARDQAVKAIELDPPGQSADWATRANADDRLRDHDDEALALTGLIGSATDHPTDGLPDQMILQVARYARGEARFGFLQALRKVNWRPEDKSLNGDALWVQLTLDLLGKGDVEEARRVARLITPDDYEVMIEMQSDRRFDPVVSADPTAFDVVKAIHANLARRKALVADNPRALEPAIEYAYALLNLNQPKPALAVADQTLAKIADTVDGKPYYDDLRTEVNRAYEVRSEALRALGRFDESLKARAQAAGYGEHGRPNVSQTLDLAGELTSMGRTKEALDLLKDFDVGRASPYGDMVFYSVVACAYAQTNEPKKLDAVMAYLRAHAQDGPSALQTALYCAGDVDAAAKGLIASIEDPERRMAALAGLQTFMQDDPDTPYARLMDEQGQLVIKRPDVRAAMAKYGHMNRYPVRGP